jgi:hypothetical protein
MIVCLPFHGQQSSSLLCVTLNALLMPLAPTYLQFQRKLMIILQGTRCWIRGSKWKRFRISHITGTKNRATQKREGVKEVLPVCLLDTAGHAFQILGGGQSWYHHDWLHHVKMKTVCDFTICHSFIDSSITGFRVNPDFCSKIVSRLFHVAFIV